MKKIVVRVTRKDIREGDSQSSSCPIALAANRLLKGDPLLEKYQLRIGCRQLCLQQKEDNSYLSDNLRETFLTKKAQRFVERFDRDRKLVKPGRFQLTLPDVD